MNDNNEQDDLKQLRDWLFTLGIVFIFVFLGVWILLWAINIVPIRESFSHDRFSILDPKEYFELRDKGIKSVIEGLKVLATIFGGIAILGNLYYAAKRAKALDASAIAANATAKAALKNAKAALKNAKAAQDKQITERFTKAVEQLASPEIAVRLGGIYALERIAKNSQDDHWTIMEVLTAFVREKCPLKEEEEREPLPKIPTDIQAALTVIGRRDCKNEEENQRLDLHNTDIRGADLSGANLKKANLNAAILEEANLVKANLEEAELRAANLKNSNFYKAILDKTILCQANLERANLQAADLKEAKLSEAILKKTNLSYADLKEAALREADLEGAMLVGAKLENAILTNANLQGADLSGANLQKAFFRQTNLQEADLSGANLRGTSLKKAINLESYQIEGAYGDSQTSLPQHLEAPEDWTKS